MELIDKHLERAVSGEHGCSTIRVHEGWLEREAAEAMLAWLHSGFGAHVGPPIAGDDRASLLRVARYDARAPLAEGRLCYHPERAEVELVSDAASGPYVGVYRLSALEFLARWVTHVPDHYETRVRYYGAYATRRRLRWQRRGVVPEGAAGITPPESLSTPATAPADDGHAQRARRRRWAELLRRVHRVEVSLCPACGGAMRIVAFVTAQRAVQRILAHLAQHDIEARAGLWADAAA
jgi:hypothetical protein